MISIVDALGQGDKLNYWGISYGTILGQVAASMFPKRVGRILLDSNLNADDYAATTWLTSVVDTERAVSNLFDDCVKSGKDACSLADFHGKNTTGESLMQTFKEKFEVATAANASEEEQTEAFVLKSTIFNKLYSAPSYPEIASKIEAFFIGNKSDEDAAEPLAEPSTWNPQLTYANLAIACGDSSFRVDDPDDLFSMYQAQYSEGSFADVNIADRLKCAKWRFAAAEQIKLNKLRNVNTSNPILVVNGRYDPVTSLRSAWEVSTKFRGSRVVVHEGVGVSITLELYAIVSC
jgi:pimeloyl-ACP methyl ester carboxylesterase